MSETSLKTEFRKQPRRSRSGSGTRHDEVPADNHTVLLSDESLQVRRRIGPQRGRCAKPAEDHR